MKKETLGFICLFIFIGIFFVSTKYKSIALLGLSEVFGFIGLILLIVALRKNKGTNTRSVFERTY